MRHDGISNQCISTIRRARYTAHSREIQTDGIFQDRPVPQYAVKDRDDGEGSVPDELPFSSERSEPVVDED